MNQRGPEEQRRNKVARSRILAWIRDVRATSVRILAAYSRHTRGSLFVLVRHQVGAYVTPNSANSLSRAVSATRVQPVMRVSLGNSVSRYTRPSR